MRQQVAEQVAAAARDDAAPVFGIGAEFFALEGIDLITNAADDFHRAALRGCRAAG
jgi:hypothetical protein